MRSFRLMAAAAVLPLVLAARPLAGPVPHTVDKAHSEINFVADSRMLSAHGFFGKWDAAVALDPQNWEASTVAITIDASSINTRVDMRDDHLRSPDFLDVAKHPTITFKSTGIRKTGEKKMDITGDLTMRGTTKQIVVPATLVFYEGAQGRFRGQFALNRKDFGVSYDSTVNPIENEVQVQWDLVLKAPAPAK
jgi:polyisoprenoid-binding protein YceI